MTRTLRLLALLVVTALAVSASSSALAQMIVPVNTTAATTTCTSVTTTPATVLAAASGRRIKWSIMTTNGTLYFKKGAGVSIGGADSLILISSGTATYYNETGDVIYSGAVSAVAKTGTIWVCADKTGN